MIRHLPLPHDDGIQAACISWERGEESKFVFIPEEGDDCVSVPLFSVLGELGNNQQRCHGMDRDNDRVVGILPLDGIPGAVRVSGFGQDPNSQREEEGYFYYGQEQEAFDSIKATGFHSVESVVAEVVDDHQLDHEYRRRHGGIDAEQIVTLVDDDDDDQGTNKTQGRWIDLVVFIYWRLQRSRSFGVPLQQVANDIVARDIGRYEI